MPTSHNSVFLEKYCSMSLSLSSNRKCQMMLSIVIFLCEFEDLDFFLKPSLNRRSLWIHNITSSSMFLIVKILCMCWPNNRSLTFAYLFDPNNPLVIPAQLVSILCSVQVCSDQTWSVLIEPSKGEHLCCKIFLPLIIKRIRYWLILPTWSCMLRESKHSQILGLLSVFHFLHKTFPELYWFLS